MAGNSIKITVWKSTKHKLGKIEIKASETVGGIQVTQQNTGISVMSGGSSRTYTSAAPVDGVSPLVVNIKIGDYSRRVVFSTDDIKRGNSHSKTMKW